MIYFIGDPHLGSPGITRWRPVFDSWEQHDAAFVERWNRTVTPRDEVYLLGDLGGSRYPSTYGRVFDAVMGLNGRIHFLRGNHDNNGLVQRIHAYGGFESVRDYVEIKTQLWSNRPATMLVMSHYPMAAWNGAFRGSVMLHGHTHGTMIPEPGIRRFDLSADLLNLTPISQFDVGALVDDRAPNIDHDALRDGKRGHYDWHAVTPLTKD